MGPRRRNVASFDHISTVQHVNFLVFFYHTLQPTRNPVKVVLSRRLTCRTLCLLTYVCGWWADEYVKYQTYWPGRTTTWGVRTSIGCRSCLSQSSEHLMTCGTLAVNHVRSVNIPIFSLVHFVRSACPGNYFKRPIKIKIDSTHTHQMRINIYECASFNVFYHDC